MFSFLLSLVLALTVGKRESNFSVVPPALLNRDGPCKEILTVNPGTKGELFITENDFKLFSCLDSFPQQVR